MPFEVKRISTESSNQLDGMNLDIVSEIIDSRISYTYIDTETIKMHWSPIRARMEYLPRLVTPQQTTYVEKSWNFIAISMLRNCHRLKITHRGVDIFLSNIWILFSILLYFFWRCAGFVRAANVPRIGNQKQNRYASLERNESQMDDPINKFPFK